jgi:hypothetical protein
MIRGYTKYTSLFFTILVYIVLISCNVERDHEDAAAVAARVHSQMETEDYSAIYMEAAQRFKTVGSEQQFVSTMHDFRGQIGLLKATSEIAYQASIVSGAGEIHVLIFRMEFERGQAIEKLSFIRSDDGRMRLWKLDYPSPKSSSTPQ